MWLVLLQVLPAEQTLPAQQGWAVPPQATQVGFWPPASAHTYGSEQ
jgi:hypothetical protein